MTQVAVNVSQKRALAQRALGTLASIQQYVNAPQFTVQGLSRGGLGRTTDIEADLLLLSKNGLVAQNGDKFSLTLNGRCHESPLPLNEGDGFEIEFLSEREDTVSSRSNFMRFSTSPFLF